MNRATTLCAIAMSLLIFGCSRDLSHDEAKRVIEQSPFIRPADNVSVDGISATNTAEAVVRATIAGQTTNLKFRRFDKGWAWEFVETKTGGWVAPDVAVGQIREERRTVAALAWAAEHREAYKATAFDMDVMVIYGPTPPQGLNAENWITEKHRFIGLFETDTRPGMQQRAKVLKDDHAGDAWGTEFSMDFNTTKNSVMVTSLGPDKKKGTDDDIVCIGQWRQVFEDGGLRWTKDMSWSIPEGLGSLVEQFTDMPYGRIEYTKAVKP
jgi:hypothetical protein